MRGWLIGTVVVAVGGGAVAWSVLREPEAKFEIQTVAVESGGIRMTIETSGTVEPLTTIQVGCEVTGKIVELTVDNDEPVRKGMVLARVDPELAEAENRQSKADLLKAQSAVASSKSALEEQTANLPVLTQQALARKQEAEAALAEAEFQWRRVEKFFEDDTASEAEYVVTKAVWERARATVMAAQASYDLALNSERFVLDQARQAVAQAEATLELAEARQAFTATRVERCTITSPIDGIVLKRYLDVGTTVVAAFQPPLLYLLAPKLDRMRVVAKVSESDISHIELGQPASFAVEARESVRFAGRITQKHNQPDIIQNVVTYTVVFEVDNDEKHTLIPGLSVNVEIECVNKLKVPQVANSALRFKPPLTLEERRELINAVTWPEKPTEDAQGEEALYCSKATVWRFDGTTRKWTPVPLWVGVTDNVNTEILGGASVRDTFVKKFVDQSGSGFDLKEAMKLASPSNRTL